VFEVKIASDWTEDVAADWSELATAVAAIVGLAATVASIWIASIKASRERNEALRQAQRDQKWRRTVEAQAAIRRLLDDQRALNAMTMLDNSADHDFPDVGEIAKSDIVSALQPVGEPSSKRKFVRAAMDSLFNHFELIQQGIDAGIYVLEDVVFPIDFYIKIIGQNDRETFTKYIEESGYHKANVLIDNILRPPSKESAGTLVRKST
jgi:hypothetical protein